MMENKNVNSIQLMRNVSESAFYVTELKLYLDTHPEDTEALELYCEAVKRAKNCIEIFEKHCYPIFASSADCECSWEWLTGCWPSEKMI